MHEQTQRLYEAARQTNRMDPRFEQSSLARLLNVAVQNVNNWGRRGVSKDAAIDAQRVLGISATWILDGIGPVFLAGQEPPTAYIANNQAQVADEQWLLDAWRTAHDEMREVARFALSRTDASLPEWANAAMRDSLNSMRYAALCWLREAEQRQEAEPKKIAARGSIHSGQTGVIVSHPPRIHPQQQHDLLPEGHTP